MLPVVKFVARKKNFGELLAILPMSFFWNRVRYPDCNELIGRKNLSSIQKSKHVRAPSPVNVNHAEVDQSKKNQR